MCMSMIPTVRVRFVEERFTVVEGEAVEVCVLAEGRIDSPFTVRVTTSDISAEGQLTSAIARVRVYCAIITRLFEVCLCLVLYIVLKI